ncbi:hypothetical protein H0H87_005902 [Tephrocybe sp. NHM501043]|nr:hypothetical protein H0H87_005902 [Tephrocybe sp. NHM501043]
MTSLRTFQTEIEEIHHRELLKQRAQVLAPTDKDKEKRLTPASLKGKAKDEGHANGADQAEDDSSSTLSGLHEIEEKILTLLLSHAPADRDTARDLVAALLTQHRGEYVLRIGLQPSHTHLFAGDLTDASDGWAGITRTIEELNRLKGQVTHIVEEVGGKILGFGPTGAPILPNSIHIADPDTVRHEKLGWEEISVQASKIVSFIGANAGLIGMSKEHLAIALALSVPVVVCITKIDMTPANKTAETIKQVVKVLKSPGCRKTPVFVKDIETAIELSTSFGSDRMCPIFQISNVTGDGLDFVRTFLNLLPSSEYDNEKFAVDQPLEFSVTEVWSVPYVGTVVNGIMNSGSAKIGDAVLLGPDSTGKVPVTTAEAGQCVSFALKRVKRASVRKGMVLVPKTETPPQSTRQFEGQVLILYHNTTLQKNYQVSVANKTCGSDLGDLNIMVLWQAMLHCGAVRQTVRIVEMDNPEGVLRTGDRATVKFEFISHPEFVKEGMKLLFREGKTKYTLRFTYPSCPEWGPAATADPTAPSSSSNAETPYPSLLPQPSGIAASYSLSPDPRQWGSDLSVNLVEPDDEIHNPARGFNATSIERGGSIFSARGLMNFGCLFILGFGLLALFAGFPIITYFTKNEPTTQGGFNLGGINATGQIPSMAGNWGLIDVETPSDVYTMPAWTSGTSELQLIFSDEFNTDGRSFYPGDDPYWEAVDLHYWATNNLEWYDPAAVTTGNGSLVVTLSAKETHGMNYEGGMITSWNKFCFTGGYIESKVQLPGPNNVVGLWPAVWTMGNLGRAGYGATLEGTWPYTYDACDVGTAPNQTLNGQPAAAVTEGDPYNDGHLSFLPGQRLSRCTCKGESHPGPIHSDGTYVGRGAPEIDIFEALFNTYIGGIQQMTTSGLAWTNPNTYEDNGQGYSIYGFEYKPGFDTGYITWIADNNPAWTFRAPGMVGSDIVKVSTRPVPQEPMYMIINLGMSENFGKVDFEHLPFPVQMRVDYIRVYQPHDSINYGCNPTDFPTAEYINTYIDAYTNPNITTWVDDYKQPWPKNSFVDGC